MRLRCLALLGLVRPRWLEEEGPCDLGLAVEDSCSLVRRLSQAVASRAVQAMALRR